MACTLLTLTEANALVAALLAFLVIFSRLHVALKAAATLAVAGLMPLTLNGLGELRGLPSDGPTPQAVRLHWARVVEPDALLGEKGHVFLGLDEPDPENDPSGIPRACQLPYDPDLVRMTESALAKISEGEEVQGMISDLPAADVGTAEELAVEVAESARTGTPELWRRRRKGR